jgi:type VI secretion system protein
MLKVISNEGDIINSITLEKESVTIGRNSNNTLVLSDPKKFISGQHATIDYQPPDYFITDNSTNGVVINNATQPVGKGSSTKLNDEDQLRIGEYIVAVTIVKEQQSIDIPDKPITNEAFDFADDPFAELDNDPVQGMIDENQWESTFDGKEKALGSESLNSPEESDFFDFDLKDDDYISKVEQPSAFKEAFQPFMAEKKQQSDVLRDDLFGDDWFTKGADDVDEAPTEPTFPATDVPEEKGSIDSAEIQPKIQQPDEETIQIEKPVDPEQLFKPSSFSSTEDTQTTALMDSFLRGAGLENTEINDLLTPESFFIIGKILRTSVQGTMDVLIGRAKIKNEMHLDVTMIRSKENNPVKFSVSAEEAIRKLLAPQDAGYLSAEEAIEEAFDDILAHQFSVVAGMQTALLEVLKRFNPQKLEQRFQQQNPISSSIPIHKQAKLWDLFEHLYNDIEHEASDNFYHLFGQAFAESYEQQIIELKKSKKISPF